MLVRLRRALIFATASCATVGCLLTTSLDGLSGGAVADDAAPEGSIEAGADGSTVVDSSPDAGADAPGVDFCDGALFCDRFDDPGRAVQGSWTASTKGFASMDLVDDAFSPPKALRFAEEATNTGQASSNLSLQIPLAPGRRFHFEFQVKSTYDPAGFGAGSYASMIVMLVDGNYIGAISLVPTGYNIGLVEYDMSDASVQNIYNKSANDSGKWVKIVIDETFTAPLGHVRAEVDGTVLVDKALKSTTGEWATATFIFGLGASGGSLPKLEVVYDDVLYR